MVSMNVGNQVVEEFCYLESFLPLNGRRSITTTGRPLHSLQEYVTFGNIEGFAHTRMRLYDSLVLTTLLYSSETWNLIKENLKQSEAAHHRWQRKISETVWKDKVTNEAWLIELRFYIPLDTNTSFLRCSSQPISGLVLIKQKKLEMHGRAQW